MLLSRHDFSAVIENMNTRLAVPTAQCLDFKMSKLHSFIVKSERFGNQI